MYSHTNRLDRKRPEYLHTNLCLIKNQNTKERCRGNRKRRGNLLNLRTIVNATDYSLPAAAARRFLGGSGFFSPSAISASSSKRDPVGVASRSFQARSPLSPFRLDFGAIHKSSAVATAEVFLAACFFEGKIHFQFSCTLLTCGGRRQNYAPAKDRAQQQKRRRLTCDGHAC